MTPALDTVLACPRCDRALDRADATFHCAGCDVDFPFVADIPWLFSEPSFTLAEWRQRFDFLQRRLEDDVAKLTTALEHDGDLLPRTRERLEHLRRAVDDHRSRLAALLAPLEIEPPRAKISTYLALRTRLPPDQGLLTYYANVHRDWCWGAAENAAAFELVRPGFASCTAAPTVLVLGSGAGRLAYDVHQAVDASLTVALDFNPFFQLAAQHIVAGERLALYEFPLAPRTHEDHAILRELAAPAPARDGLAIVLGDVLRPPFKRNAFDVVLTPWLVDIVPEDLGTLARRVNALLCDGGTWINVGSLAFMEMAPARQYSPDECAAVLAHNGFAPPTTSEAEIPYMCSPASRHGRRELAFAWHAGKTSKAKAPPRYEALPHWLVKGTEPVPLLDAFRLQATSTRVYAGLMSLIDGRRSIKDMAKVLVDQQLLAASEAEPAIRKFLTRMYDDSRRPDRV